MKSSNKINIEEVPKRGPLKYLKLQKQINNKQGDFITIPALLAVASAVRSLAGGANVVAKTMNNKKKAVDKSWKK